MAHMDPPLALPTEGRRGNIPHPFPFVSLALADGMTAADGMRHFRAIVECIDAYVEKGVKISNKDKGKLLEEVICRTMAMKFDGMGSEVTTLSRILNGWLPTAQHGDKVLKTYNVRARKDPWLVGDMEDMEVPTESIECFPCLWQLNSDKFNKSPHVKELLPNQRKSIVKVQHALVETALKKRSIVWPKFDFNAGADCIGILDVVDKHGIVRGCALIIIESKYRDYKSSATQQGGSDPRSGGAWGQQGRSAGPPQARPAPSGGSDPRSGGAWGHHHLRRSSAAPAH